MPLKRNPYYLLLPIGLLLVLLSFFTKQDNTVDIHVHDTYYILAQTHVWWLLASLVLFLWFLYWLTRKWPYSKWLTWIHVIVTLTTILFFIFLLSSGSGHAGRRYVDLSSWNSFGDYHENIRWMTYCLVLLLLGQVVFLINFVIGLIKRLY